MSKEAERIEAARRAYVAALGTFKEAETKRALEQEIAKARKATRA